MLQCLRHVLDTLRDGQYRSPVAVRSAASSLLTDSFARESYLNVGGIVKRLLVMGMAAVSFAVGGAAAVVAAPAPSAARHSCPNITCYLPDPYTLYCGFYGGWQCSMADPDHCSSRPCDAE